jgi:hypothetical protein
MRLANTLGTISDTTAEEDWVEAPGMRIIPENAIEENALAQIWASQRNRECPLDGRDTPFDRASFDERVEFTTDGFASGMINLSKTKFNPMTVLKDNKAIPITVFWLWQHDKIIATWSIEATEYNPRQSNYAMYPVVFI